MHRRARKCAFMHTSTRTRTHARMQARIHAHTHACTHARTRLRMHRACTHTHTHAHLCTCARMHMHTHTTHTHTYVRVIACLGAPTGSQQLHSSTHTHAGALIPSHAQTLALPRAREFVCTRACEQAHASSQPSVPIHTHKCRESCTHVHTCVNET